MERLTFRKPRNHFDTLPHPSCITFDDGKLMRRTLPWIHFGEARWTYAEPDVIYIEIASFLVSIIGYNLGPLFIALEEHQLLRVRAHPEFATSTDHAEDSFATQIRFSNLPAVRGKAKTNRPPELELEIRQ
jgi:hypothetical protein